MLIIMDDVFLMGDMAGDEPGDDDDHSKNHFDDDGGGGGSRSPRRTIKSSQLVRTDFNLQR